jgi:predicted AAA+ superfamily ATPase
LNTNTNNFPRQLKSQIDIAMQDTPVVLINGPRQSGKTTLVKEYSPSLPYYTLDDENILNAVKQDPVGFINRIDKAIIDEIQRAPELLRAIKLSIVDRVSRGTSTSASHRTVRESLDSHGSYHPNVL